MNKTKLNNLDWVSQGEFPYFTTVQLDMVEILRDKLDFAEEEIIVLKARIVELENERCRCCRCCDE